MKKNKHQYNLNKPEKQSFLRNHADTFAIMGLNLAIAAILTSMWLSNSHRVDAVNSRMDTMQGLIYQEIKDFHGRLCSIEERNRK
jgi:hypothetical protein